MDSDLGKKLESDKKNIMSFKLTGDLENGLKLDWNWQVYLNLIIVLPKLKFKKVI